MTASRADRKYMEKALANMGHSRSEHTQKHDPLVGAVLDQAVAAAYGWSDLDLGHGFHETKQGVRYTLSESARHTVLDRLLALNHERYEEEVIAGLHEKKAKGRKMKDGGKRGASGASPQPELLPDPQNELSPE